MNDRTRSLVVAIDGPSGVGKSTVARKVADRLEIPYLDTGAMYRCLALTAVRDGRADDASEESVAALLEGLRLEVRVAGGQAHLQLNGIDVGEEIRTPEVTEATSRFAAIPEVRRWMVQRQQEFGSRCGGVVEGRDIGTVVFPATPFKFFLDATNEVRAKRRWQQLRPTHPDLSLEQVARDLEERDQRDTAREDSPLVRTKEHILVDTAGADADGVAQRIVEFVTVH